MTRCLLRGIASEWDMHINAYFSLQWSEASPESLSSAESEVAFCLMMSSPHLAGAGKGQKGGVIHCRG